MTGVVVGWVSDQLVVCELAVGSVVFAVGIGFPGVIKYAVVQGYMVIQRTLS